MNTLTLIPTSEKPMPEGKLCLFTDSIALEFGIRTGENVTYFYQDRGAPLTDLKEAKIHSIPYHWVGAWWQIGE
jgi:hypothetical protein